MLITYFLQLIFLTCESLHFYISVNKILPYVLQADRNDAELTMF